MGQTVEVIDLNWDSVMPSLLGRTFATKAACLRYCHKEGFTTIARVKGNSGVFYAPYLGEVTV